MSHAVTMRYFLLNIISPKKLYLPKGESVLYSETNLGTQATLNISKGNFKVNNSRKQYKKMPYANNTENVPCQKQPVVYACIETLIYNQM